MTEENDLASQLLLHRSSPVPLYHQIAEQLEAAIRSGQLQPGDRIENELSLAEKTGLSRPTIRQAIDVLVRKGLVSRKRGVGTQVAAAGLNRRVELSSLYDDLETAGKNPSTKVLCFRQVDDELEIPELFQQEGIGMVLYIERLRLADAQPLAFMRNWVAIQPDKMSREQLETGSLYALLHAAGRSPALAHQKFSAQAATEAQAALLKTEDKGPLLMMARTAYDEAGQLVEYAEHLYCGNAYAVEVMVDAK